MAGVDDGSGDGGLTGARGTPEKDGREAVALDGRVKEGVW